MPRIIIQLPASVVFIGTVTTLQRLSRQPVPGNAFYNRLDEQCGLQAVGSDRSSVGQASRRLHPRSTHEVSASIAWSHRIRTCRTRAGSRLTAHVSPLRRTTHATLGMPHCCATLHMPHSCAALLMAHCASLLMSRCLCLSAHVSVLMSRCSCFTESGCDRCVICVQKTRHCLTASL